MSGAATAMTYRRDIDGLRAIAVLAVVAYHAGLFASGYIGVDIFFVISGYLITGIVVRPDISLVEFYRRRVMRLLPALLLVIGVSAAIGWILLAPEEMIEFAGSSLAALFFVSNFFFYNVTSDYGAGTSQLKPLLHTWSLAVEEQFYIVFPLVVMAFRKHLKLLLWALFAASLAFACWLETTNPALNFYHPFSRAFEILAGALLALSTTKGASAPPAVGWAGLGLVGLSFAIFDGTTAHPSLITLLPVVGTCMVLAAPVRVLAVRPAAWIGVLSYSFYLWHFPIFAFVRLDNATPEAKDFLAAALVALLFATLSYYLVERPFRRGRGWHQIVTAMGCVAAVVFTWTGMQSGFDSRIVKRVFVEQEEAINAALGEACLTSPCDKEGDGPRIAFIGDSHARVLAASLQDDLSAHARHYNFGNSCPFFWGGAGLEDCTSERQVGRLAALAEFEPDVIILSSRLAGYLRGGFFEGGETIKVTPEQIKDGVEQLRKLAPVMAIYPTPAFSRGVVHSVQLTGEATTGRTEFDAWVAPAFEVLDDLDVARFKPHEYLCDESFCYGYRDETVLFFDDDHMSAAAVLLFRDDLFEQINGVLPAEVGRIK